MHASLHPSKCAAFAGILIVTSCILFVASIAMAGTLLQSKVGAAKRISVSDGASLQKCICGDAFLPDSASCVKCGQRRPEEPAFDFEVALTRNSVEDSLGLNVLLLRDKVYYVQHVDENGLIAAWNNRQQDSSMKVLSEDVIVAVNGVSHDAELMLGEMAARAVTLAVLHGTPRTGIAAQSSSRSYLGDVTIHLLKQSEEEPLGLGCADSAGGNFLLVREVAEAGAVARWNSKAAESKAGGGDNPRQHVLRAGDRIVSVNGVSGRGGLQALEELRRPQTELELTIRPCPTLRSAAAEQREMLSHLAFGTLELQPAPEGEEGEPGSGGSGGRSCLPRCSAAWPMSDCLSAAPLQADSTAAAFMQDSEVQQVAEDAATEAEGGAWSTSGGAETQENTAAAAVGWPSLATGCGPKKAC
eukprot:TRINITY_DN44639_c0_g1_i1.p1 TRINITY_DN44639_c0_g1~~TRINITY_DN44639_c0_g1_i1.p1  ORF type:complete len:415 (+),score=104.71 TRINITY_DN44639_c0_g1_i1:59-1303(+)